MRLADHPVLGFPLARRASTTIESTYEQSAALPVGQPRGRGKARSGPRAHVEIRSEFECVATAKSERQASRRRKMTRRSRSRR